jgi:hypothetical protein
VAKKGSAAGKARLAETAPSDRGQHRPDLLDCEGRNEAGPHNCGYHTSTDQYDGKICGRQTGNMARDFRHTLKNSGRHDSNKALAGIDRNNAGPSLILLRLPQ